MGNPLRFLLPLFFTLHFLPFCSPYSGGDGAIISLSDFQSLLAFKREADPNGVLRSWNGTRTGACAWTGVKCVSGQVIALQLPFKGLAGQIPDQIGLLRDLRKLSLHDNFIVGVIPPSIGLLPNLRGLHLFNNRLSGSIPPSIGRNPSLQNLDLSDNMLNGSIPPALGNAGRIRRLNLSHNRLSGEVPSTLSKKFNSSSFVGNPKLCGYSSSTQCLSSSSSPPVEAKHRSKQRPSTKDIILILVGSILAFLFLLCCAFLCVLIRTRDGPIAGNAQKEVEVVESGDNGGGGGKLVLFDGPFVFTANDLLCATAEVMGKNAYGTVYKATIEDGNRVAVKRLREKLAKSPKEFEIEAAALGRIRHPNLLPLRAYYLGPKGEKLLVSDCLSNGTLSSFLHGHGPETSIGWSTRMKIAVGIANGLRHLHVVENFAHGNLTAAEVYLDERNEPKISDFGISRLMTDSANTSAVANGGGLAGYRAPELQRTKRATAKSDLYSLGVILLELLTGKSPGELIDGVDLPHWVASTVKEEWTNEVFDVELMEDVGDEMLNALKLALHLVDPTPEVRPEVEVVMQQLEQINPE